MYHSWQFMRPRLRRLCFEKSRIKNIYNMKKSYLLPRSFKKVGMVLAVCCLVWFTINCFTEESVDFKFKTFALIGDAPFSHASGNSYQSSSSFCNMVETSFGMTIAPVLMLTALVLIVVYWCSETGSRR